LGEKIIEEILNNDWFPSGSHNGGKNEEMCVNGDSSFERLQQFCANHLFNENFSSLSIRHFVGYQIIQSIQIVFENLKK
jgi:hypothetical protein